jgi:DNA topoisomerase-1
MKLLIVESPAKAKTIEKYLGSDWRVIASIGHVRDLVPEDGSVDTGKDFAMKWQIMPGKEKQIKAILDLVKGADAVYLASDPDREGEAISWHILDILNSRGALKGKPVYRVVFHEITKKAIQAAIDQPREIDQNLVDAYLVRRALDYLIGFKLSPVLWRKNMGKSAGRVQSVAVALIVSREREIEKFKSVEYWSLDAECKVQSAEYSFLARLSQFNGEKIEKMSIENKDRMDEIISALCALNSELSGVVSSVEKKKTQRKPAAPFTTSTLQQEAARKLRFSAKRTSMAAQHLYEQGLVTYIRTDSTNLSSDAVTEIRGLIEKEYGERFLPKSANAYATKSKNAQEAHEAIRPTSVSASVSVSGDEAKLYDIIWKRTVASQMTNAEFDSVAVDIQPQSDARHPIPDTLFHAVGTTRTFDGFLKVYVEGTDDEEDKNETKLPPLNVGDKVDIIELKPEQHFTNPPPRYTEASLIKKLEELGIGRPSTYATIMSTIVDREYVSLEKQRFFATSAGWLLSAFLTKYFSEIVDVNFTAKTEDTLDDVSNGTQKLLPALNTFWNAFLPLVTAAQSVSSPEVMAEVNAALREHLFPDDNDKCPECGGSLGLKVSRYGAFLGCGNYPTCKYTKDMTLLASRECNTECDPNKKDDCKTTCEPVSSTDPLDLGEDIKFIIGRFGPYVQQGAGKEAKRMSAKQYNHQTITLEIAKELLEGGFQKADPIELGKHPATDARIYFYPTGRYGAYITSNKVNVGVKEQPDLEKAIDLINNKKPSAKKPWGRKK